MHFEILVEDQSGKKTLDTVVPKMIGEGDSFKVIPYKGIGRIPKDLVGKTDPRKRILLDRLPKLLGGYGRTFSQYPDGYSAVVIVVCDLDDRCQKTFRDELVDVLDATFPKPAAYFCLAIEEGEAWLLGDLPAVLQAYPRARMDVLRRYVNDSICGTWETLADAIHPGGSGALSKSGWQAVGMEKAKWASDIAPDMDVASNKSPSFQYLREKIQLLASPVGVPL